MGAHEQFRLSSPNMGLSHLTYIPLEIAFEEPINSRMKTTSLMYQIQPKRAYSCFVRIMCVGDGCQQQLLVQFEEYFFSSTANKNFRET
jgi:hypothetical protein